MDKQFYIIKENRKTFIKLVEALTLEQLNEIPEGFNNNIAWNFCHMVVIQQVLCYEKAGKELKIDKAIVDKYKRGTKPEAFIGKEELEFFKQKAIELIDIHQQDWNAGILTEYQAFTTLMGVAVNDCEEALHYTATHDQLHLGYSMAVRRLVLNKALVSG